MYKIMLSLLLCVGLIGNILAGQAYYTVSVASTSCTMLIESGAYDSITISADTYDIYISTYNVSVVTNTAGSYKIIGDATPIAIKNPSPLYVRGSSATVTVSYILEAHKY